MNSAEELAVAAEKVLSVFRAGYNPTEAQLHKLEGALYPFVTLKICGHKIIEDCNCKEEQQ